MLAQSKACKNITDYFSSDKNVSLNMEIFYNIKPQNKPEFSEKKNASKTLKKSDFKSFFRWINIYV